MCMCSYDMSQRFARLVANILSVRIDVSRLLHTNSSNNRNEITRAILYTGVATCRDEIPRIRGFGVGFVLVFSLELAHIDGGPPSRLSRTVCLLSITFSKPIVKIKNTRTHPYVHLGTRVEVSKSSCVYVGGGGRAHVFGSKGRNIVRAYVFN